MLNVVTAYVVLKIFYVAAHVFVMMECKKNLHFSSFAECCDHDTRQRIFFKKKFKLCRVPVRGHSAKNFFKKKSNFAECRTEGTRQRIIF